MPPFFPPKKSPIRFNSANASLWTMVRVCLTVGFLSSGLVEGLNAADLASYVDPLIGTEGKGTEYGGTVPSVGEPFASVYFSPMTRLNAVSVAAYNHLDSRLIGFIATRQPAVWMGDYGQLTLSPGIGLVQIDPILRSRPILRETEKPTPERYSVTTGTGDADSISTDMASARSSGILRVQFPNSPAPHMILDVSRAYGKPEQAALAGVKDYAPANALRRSSQFPADGYVRIEPEKKRIVCWNSDRQSRQLGPLALPNFKGWYVVEFSQPFKAYGVYTGVETADGKMEAKADALGAYVYFPDGTKEVVVRVGASLISEAQAKQNLASQIPGWAVEPVAKATRQAWNDVLGRIEIQSPNEDWKKIFYTAMYRASQFPRELTESGKYYSAFDDKVHDGSAFTDFSLWDTYRAQFPLMTLVAPELAGAMVDSLLHAYREGGWLPLWSNPAETNIMVGSPAEVVIATALAAGLPFDLKLAREAIIHQAFTPPDTDEKNRWGDRATGPNGWPVEARGGLTNYMNLGYVAADKTSESVSRTLDYSFADWCSARTLRAAGDEKTAKLLEARQANYKKLFDAEWAANAKTPDVTGYFGPRNADGSWLRKAGANFTETSPTEALFAVPHDIEGVIQLLGGRPAFAQRLDHYFNAAKAFRFDNEPAHHVPYLWNYADHPEKTQEIVRKTLTGQYHTSWSGYAGNEDCGQMSAWFVLSSLGIYPVNPASGRYDLGAPLWNEASLKIGAPYKPAVFTVKAVNQSLENRYVKTVSLNGKVLNRLWVTHQEIVAGGTLEFVMSATPANGK